MSGLRASNELVFEVFLGSEEGWARPVREPGPVLKPQGLPVLLKGACGAILA